jgi:DNA-binding transcriptional regulator YdaS (Cro superfamily)
MQTALDKAASHCGGLSKLATELGVSSQVLTNWRARGVPIERCAELEEASGKTVRRWELRPDDWHRIWPELIGAEGAPAIAEAEQGA